MEAVIFKSMPRQTPFAPEWFWIMGEDTIKTINFTKIAELILSKEKEIISAHPPASAFNNTNADGYTGLGDNSLTSRYKYFNVLSWEDEEIQKLKDQIFKSYLDFLKMCNVPRTKMWIQCWANVMRPGEEIRPHLHGTGPYCYLGGHVCVQCEDTSTVYINPINQLNDPELRFSHNEVGKFTIFQNNIPHYTTKHLGKFERITIAFDLVPDIDTESVELASNLILFDDLD